MRHARKRMTSCARGRLLADGSDDVGIGGAATQVAAHALANFGIIECRRRGDVVIRPGGSVERLGAWLPSITVHEVGLGDRIGLAAVVAAAAAEQVFHLAVADRRSTLPDLADTRLSISDDLGNLVNLIAACAAAPVPPAVFVRAGSLAEYGATAAPYDEAQRELPLDSYAAGLVAGTHYAQMLRSRVPFAICTARLALTYGPAQSERFLMPLLIRRCLAGEPIRIARPQDRRDLMHVDDAVGGLLRLAERPLAPVVNLATGLAPTMADVAAMVCAATGADPQLIALGPRHTPGGIADFRGSGELARRLLDWAPQTALADGLARTIAWHREQARLEALQLT